MIAVTGSGSWLKIWTTAAQFSQWGALLARTNASAPKHSGITYFLLDMRSEGVEVKPLRELTGNAMFNTVFIDAPCTGSGTLIRHPELRWKLQKPSVSTLVETQKQILAGIAPLVAPGGALIYAVCSVFPEEGAQQIAAFLAAHPQFELVSWLETLSHHDAMDGFFAAKLRNRSGAPNA